VDFLAECLIAAEEKIRLLEGHQVSLTAGLKACQKALSSAEQRNTELEQHMSAALKRIEWLQQALASETSRCEVADALLAEASRRASQAEVRRASQAELAKQAAELESVSVRAHSPSVRKKILLKWHPDKQPGEANRAFATKVMQELQNRPEWIELLWRQRLMDSQDDVHRCAA